MTTHPTQRTYTSLDAAYDHSKNHMPLTHYDKCFFA